MCLYRYLCPSSCFQIVCSKCEFPFSPTSVDDISSYMPVPARSGSEVSIGGAWQVPGEWNLPKRRLQLSFLAVHVRVQNFLQVDIDANYFRKLICFWSHLFSSVISALPIHLPSFDLWNVLHFMIRLKSLVRPILTFFNDSPLLAERIVPKPSLCRAYFARLLCTQSFANDSTVLLSGI